MTDAPTIKPGDHINGVEILSLDQLGKRAVVSRPCGGTHVYGIEALMTAGIDRPAARPRTKQTTKEQVK